MVDGVERTHAGQHVHQERGCGQSKIDISEDIDCLVRAGSVLPLGQGRKLKGSQPQPHLRRTRDDQQQEDHDSQASDEVRRGTPEQQAVRQRLNVVKDCRAGRRESGNTFKPGVYNRERPAPKRIRKHPEDEGQQPGQRDDHIAVLKGDASRFPYEYEREHTDGEGDREADHQGGEGTVIAVRHRDQNGQEHEQRTDKQSVANVSGYHLDVHLDIL